MKLSDLRQAVVELNDGENIDRDSALITATNLALGHIARIIPAEGSVTITQDKPLAGVAGAVDTDHATFTVSGASGIVFRTRGSGALNNGATTIRTWTGYTDIKTVRVFINPAADMTLSFKDVVGGVWDFAVFPYISSEAAIPEYGEYVAYDLKARREDFISPLRHPMTRQGDPVSGCFYQQTHLYVPSCLVGDIVVRYKRKQNIVTHTALSNDDEVDIDAGIEDILPLLVSYYIWLEDEPSKAEGFLRLFNTYVALAKSESRSDGNRRVYSVNDW